MSMLLPSHPKVVAGTPGRSKIVDEVAPFVSTITRSATHEWVALTSTARSPTSGAPAGTTIVLTVGGPGTLVPLPSATGIGVSVDAYVMKFVPLPESGMFAGEPGALLVIATFPVAGPGTVGPKVAVNVVACAGSSVRSVPDVFTLKPGPEGVIDEMTTPAVPLLVSVTVTGSLEVPV